MITPVNRDNVTEELSRLAGAIQEASSGTIPEASSGTMPNEEKMTIDECRKYLKMQQKRYRQANWKERGRLLDEMGSITPVTGVTRLHRKGLIRLMKSTLERKPRRLRQRGRTYGIAEGGARLRD